eukprot:m.152550 g.152550  ORF g.152550 m.152550 type:complete len:143 (+) comp14324_c0_seq7:1344-1772(+)
MIRLAIVIVIALATATHSQRDGSRGGGSAKSGRMNILMIASDDLRPQLGCYQPETWVGQHAEMHTPNIDALANRSVVFLRAYCQQVGVQTRRTSIPSARTGERRVEILLPFHSISSSLGTPQLDTGKSSTQEAVLAVQPPIM